MRVPVSYVINFRVDLVIIPRWLCFRSSCLPRVYVDYYFYGWGCGLREGELPGGSLVIHVWR